MSAPDANGWMPIETAHEHELERVLVAGWQKRSGTVAGYWWIHEDAIYEGKPIDSPNALLWQPLPKLPSEPPEWATR